MKVQYICCAGLDVHKRIVVACVLKGAFGEEVISKVKSFGTTTPELMEMIEWLKSCGATHVAMEATGNYWMPIYNLLEGHFELVVANAAHMKAVPGRKSDVQDAEWIAELLRHGLLRSSFIPSREQRDLRELTRHRSSLAGKRAQAANELQKSLESASIKLQSVVTDITGAMEMFAGIDQRQKQSQGVGSASQAAPSCQNPRTDIGLCRRYGGVMFKSESLYCFFHQLIG